MASGLAQQQSRLKKLIALGREQGYLTYAEVNDHLPDDISDPEQIEDIISMINDMGILVQESARTFLNQNTHIVNHADDVFDLLWIRDVIRQVIVNLCVGEVTLLASKRDELFQSRLLLCESACHNSPLAMKNPPRDRTQSIGVNLYFS